MSISGDHDADMSPNWQLDDETIEAIVRGESVDAHLAPLVAFARDVRVVGDQTVPRASTELLALLDKGDPSPALDPVARLVRSPAGRRATGRARRFRRRPRVPLMPALAAATSKVAGLGFATKMGLGAAALTGMTAAGAAGTLPSPANDAVRSAIEIVTPVDFAQDGGGSLEADDNSVGGGGSAEVEGPGGSAGVEGSGGADANGNVGGDVDAEGPGIDDLPVVPGLPPVAVPELPVDLPIDVPTTLPELPVDLPVDVPTTLPPLG